MALAGIREMNSKGFWKPPGYGISREFRGKSHSRETGKFLGNASKNGKFLGKRQISGENRQNSGIAGKNRQFSGKFLGKIGKFSGENREISGKSANFWEMSQSPQKFISRERPSGIREMISRERRSGIRDKSLRDTTLHARPFEPRSKVNFEHFDNFWR